MDFGQNSTLRLWRQITMGNPRVHFGANRVPLGPRNVSKLSKITMPTNSNFRLPRGYRFRPKFDFTVMAPNHFGDSLGSILGPKGSHWVQKRGQNRKKLPCPKIQFCDYPHPRSLISTKIRLYGYGAKSRWGTPRIHLWPMGLLGPNNGSKP